MGAPDARARLADLLDQRRRDLRLTWDQVASRAGIHRETLRQIRAGTGAIRPLSATGIEDALEWDRGSIDALLAGGEAAADTDNEPIWQRLATAVRARRDERGWTQLEVAARGGLSIDRIQAIEGTRSDRYSSRTFAKLERALEWESGSCRAILDGGDPTPADLVRTLAETTANLDAYIERRAQEIAAPRIAAAEKQARELVAAVWHTAAFEKQRQDDLRTELGRQLDAAWKNYERLRAESVPLPHDPGRQ